jgi:hypothetical protein
VLHTSCVLGDCSQCPATGRLPRAASCVGGAAPPPQPTRAAVATTSSARQRVRGSRDSSNSARTCLHAHAHRRTHTRRSRLACLLRCTHRRCSRRPVARRRKQATRASRRPARLARAQECVPSRRRHRLFGPLMGHEMVRNAPQAAPRGRRASSGGLAVAYGHSPSMHVVLGASVAPPWSNACV